jgi:tetratricopeptide (TPR) repeat protein
MSNQSPKDVFQDGASDIAGVEERKSRLIVEASLLRDQQQYEAAADKLAQAAEVEEQLSQCYGNAGLKEKTYVHQFSAASLWAQAGNFYQAIALCDRMLLRSDLPDRLRHRVENYRNIFRTRRDQWYGELAVQSATEDAPV